MFRSNLPRTFLLAGMLAAFTTDLAQAQGPARPAKSVAAAVQTLIGDLEQTVMARRVSLSCEASTSLRKCLEQTVFSPPRSGPTLSREELSRLRDQLGNTGSYITNAEAACPFEAGEAIELVRPTGRSLLVFNRHTCRQMLFVRGDDSDFSVNRLFLSADINR